MVKYSRPARKNRANRYYLTKKDLLKIQKTMDGVAERLKLHSLEEPYAFYEVKYSWSRLSTIRYPPHVRGQQRKHKRGKRFTEKGKPLSYYGMKETIC